jgi:hypothetical protein
MRHTLLSMLAASTLSIAAIVGMSTSAQSQTVIIITGNGSAQPYYPQAYPYPYQQQHVVYDEPGYYPAYGYAASNYYQPYYNGYYRPYGYGYYRPHRYGGW